MATDFQPRVLVVGASATAVCGVRDYASTTSDAMRALGATVDACWWERRMSMGLAGARSEARGFLREFDQVVERVNPDIVLWHYSVFTWSLRGIPLLGPEWARRLSARGVPVVALLHEFAFEFGEGGARGTTWAATHRIALRMLWPALAGAIATTEERRAWLLSRRWLADRPVLFLPVCSNLPTPARPTPRGNQPTIGVFGYATDEARAALVVAALARLRGGGLATRLVLVGAPSPSSPAGRVWSEAAERAGFDGLEFTGILDSADLAAVLASVDVVLSVDRAGPMSRKGTLAASLSLAKPVVAISGPQTWQQLVKEQAVLLVPPRADGIAAVLESLLSDVMARTSQGGRGAAFYARWMQPERLGAETLSFLSEIMGSSSKGAVGRDPLLREIAP
jgi:glycosyltransferase involved in cell wall biosynthesis